MKRICILVLFGLFCFDSEAQFRTSVNDTSYVRILDGIVLDNDSFIENINSMKYVRQKETIAGYGFDTAKIKKPLMILQTANRTLTEEKINIALYSDQKFLKKYNLPLDLHLPISVNGKLLLNDQRDAVLKTINYQQIKSIRYSVSSALTPFGVIDVTM